VCLSLSLRWHGRNCYPLLTKLDTKILFFRFFPEAKESFRWGQSPISIFPIFTTFAKIGTHILHWRRWKCRSGKGRSGKIGRDNWWKAVIKEKWIGLKQSMPTSHQSSIATNDLSRAARAVFGNDLVVSGCWFHFAQALVKHMHKLGLVTPLLEDSRLKTLFRCLLSLPLLPVDEMRSGFEDVKSTCVC